LVHTGHPEGFCYNAGTGIPLVALHPIHRWGELAVLLWFFALLLFREGPEASGSDLITPLAARRNYWRERSSSEVPMYAGQHGVFTLSVLVVLLLVLLPCRDVPQMRRFPMGQEEARCAQ